MDDNIIVSIICPVYKTACFLHRCVDSILSQTFSQFELLLIDDGSPDDAGKICDEYAKMDSRVRVFHKENGGLADARQYGLDRIRGEYLIHIDSDDWVEPTMLEELYRKAKEERADVVVCDHYVNYGTYQKYVKDGPISSDPVQAINDIITKYNGCLWNKLIRVECYQKPQKVEWIIGQNVFEDLIVCTKILLSPRKIVYLEKAFYHYIQNVNLNSYMSQTKGMYEQRIRLNHIMNNLLSDVKYNHSRLFLKKMEAIAALEENVFFESRI